MTLKQFCLTYLTAALVFTMTARAQLVSDDFGLRGSITHGDVLAGKRTQVGDETSVYSNTGLAAGFQFENEAGVGVAKFKMGQTNASNSFAIPSMPTYGTVTFNATVNFNEHEFSDLAGAWVGLTAADDGLIFNSKVDHVGMRLLPIGENTGRINLRTNQGAVFSLSAEALTVEKNRDYVLKLKYNYKTLELTGTVVDSVTDSSTSVSMKLNSAVKLNRGQFEFTGGTATDELANIAYFKDISVTSELPEFLKPPQFVGVPDAAHMVTNRAITLVSSMAVTPGDRLWATWYTGVVPGEGPHNYVVLSTSGDGGETWEEVLVVDPDFSGPVRAFDSQVWVAPDGNLYWTWAQTVGHDGSISGVWAIKITNPEDEKPQYEAPVRWTDGIMMNKPTVLSTGEWVLPVSTWRNTELSAKMVTSVDAGETWQVRGGAYIPKGVRAVDEHSIIERKDGSLWLLCRTRYGIGESVSLDRGKTWSEVTPSDIPHANARFFIGRLHSGNLLLVKHGDIDKEIGRSRIQAFISKDDGATWQGGLMLDERGQISYPDGQQAADGTIYITYDHGRAREREILLATFREEDVLAGIDVSGKLRLRQLISKGSGGRGHRSKEAIQIRSNDDGVALDVETVGAFDTAEYKIAALSVGEFIFTDRGYTVEAQPKDLRGFSILQVPLEGAKNYVCSTEGMVYFLTPQTGRNPFGQEAALLKQGFRKVALPEIELFSAQSKRSNQLCSLYQKYCHKGERIRLDKWAVPLMAPKNL